MKKYEYHTHLVRGPLNSVYAEFPFDVKKEFGSRKAVRVKVTLDGQPFDLTLLPHAGHFHWLHLKKEIRLKIGKEEGDLVFVTVEKDESVRTVKIPDYLQWLLEDDPEMEKAFGKLSYFFKNFWVNHIEESKNEDTKVERINKLFDFLRQGRSG